MLTFGVLLSITIRIFLFISPSINLTECPELVTPLSSMHRVREGISLARSGSSPYEGNLFHQPPLVIAFLFPFFDDKGSTPRYDGMPLQILFFIADVLVAYMLRSIMSRKLVRDGYGNGTAGPRLAGRGCLYSGGCIDDFVSEPGRRVAVSSNLGDVPTARD